MKHRYPRLLMLSILAVIVAVGLPLCAFFGFSTDDTRLLLTPAADYNSGWAQRTPHGDRPLSVLPHALAANRKTVTLVNTLPEICSHGMALMFRTDGELVTASIDGTEIWSHGRSDKLPFGSHTGPVWCLIPLPEGEAGRELTLTLTARSHAPARGYYDFRLDNRSALVISMVMDNLFILVNSLVSLIVGVIIVLDATYRWFRKSSQVGPRRCLGLTAIYASIWAFTESGLTQLITGNAAFGHLLSHTMFYLVGAPFAKLLAHLMPRYFKVFRGLSLCFSGVFLLAAGLYVGGIAEFDQMLMAEHSLIVGCAVTALAAVLISPVERTNRLMLTGTVSFAVSVVLAFCRTYFLTDTRLPGTIVLLLNGLDIMILCAYLSLLRHAVHVDITASEYERQAYVDEMTGVGSRTALEHRLSGLERLVPAPLAVFMVDLNNLKLVNDTLGHDAGDRLICDLAACLKATFPEPDSIFRFGGDEFVVLLEGCTHTSAGESRDLLMRAISSHNKLSSCEIEAAVGVAVRNPATDKRQLSARDLLSLADTEMYHLKQRQKNEGLPSGLSRLIGEPDPLTGLLTLDSFRRRVRERLNAPDHPPLAVVTFDVNHFDGYNSLFGWNEGDNLLRRLADVAMRIRGTGGFCAHGEADTYWVLLEFSDPDRVYARIREETARFDRQMSSIKLFLSFGLYKIDDPGLPVREMCNRARIAKHTVKGRFNQLYALYNAEQQLQPLTKLRMTGYMPSGLDNNEFRAYYQPLVSLADGRLAGAEALVRWVHEDGTVTPPSEFVDLFEQNGLLLKLDLSMFERVCSAQRRRQAMGIPCLPVSVNLSRMHAYTRNGARTFRTIVDDYELPVELVRIELTETAIVADDRRVSAFVDELRAEGFRVLMDDFGSGLSSLGQLNRISVDGLKLDRAFLSGGHEYSVGWLMIESVLLNCRKAGLLTIAEGVESAEHFRFLRSRGCDLAQGSIVSMPVPEEEYDRLLQSGWTLEVDD